MKPIRLIFAALCLQAVAACATTSLDNEPENRQRAIKSTHFFEQTEPTISIRPLSPEQQQAKEKTSNPKLDVTPLATATIDTATPTAPAKQTWEIKTGDNLRTTLESWCKRSGYDLNWNVKGDFESGGSNVFVGNVEDAINDLFAAIPEDLHLNVAIGKNKLVYVTTMGVK